MSGSLLHSPGRIIQELAIAFSLGIEGPSEDPWVIYLNTLPDKPDSAIEIIDRQGITHGRLFTGETQEHHGLQFIFRSPDIGDAYVKSRQFIQWMDTTVYRDEIQVDEAVYLVHAITRQGESIFIGPEVDVTRRYLYSLNAIAAIRLLYELGTGT